MYDRDAFGDNLDVHLVTRLNLGPRLGEPLDRNFKVEQIGHRLDEDAPTPATVFVGELRSASV
jgi:hypothetical protein